MGELHWRGVRVVVVVDEHHFRVGVDIVIVKQILERLFGLRRECFFRPSGRHWF